MKKAIFTLLFITAFTVMGQEQKQQKSGDAYHEKMTPEQMATLQTKKMVLALDLTQEQQTKIEKLNLENAKNRQAKIVQWKAEKESGEVKKSTAEDRFAMANDRLDHQIAMHKQMKQILNAEQFEKWKNMGQPNGRHHGHRKGQGVPDGSKGRHMHGKK